MKYRSIKTTKTTKTLKTIIAFQVFFISFVLLITSWMGYSISPPDNENGKSIALTVIPDPRVELLSLIFRLAGNSEYQGGRFLSYDREVMEYFEKYKNHEVVKLAAELRKNRGISFDAVMKMAIFVSDTDALQERIPFEPHLHRLEERWTAEDGRRFLEAARDFVKRTKFKQFIKKHQPLYDATAAKLRDAVAAHARLDWFDSFFGNPPDAAFIVIPGMMNGGGSYGPKITLPDGKTELYSIIGVWKMDKSGAPTFDSNTVNIIVHEFCHSFVNPLVDMNYKTLDKAGQQLFPPVAEAMEKQAYTTWKTVLYESLVRAAVIRYIHSVQGAEAANKEIQENINRSFFWIKDLADLLAEYETQRSKYPTLNDFMPRIIQFFNRYPVEKVKSIIAQIKERKQKQLDFIKTKGPKIASMVPANGSINVDPGLKTITITFDRPMRPRDMAVLSNGKNFPELTGKAHFGKENKVFYIPVKLRAGKTYEFGLNAVDMWGFKSLEGIPLYPVAVTFSTRK
jgi:hypothetical protein